MESFIIRVYRRSRSNPGEVAGLVETVGTEEKKTFQTFSGLINALRKTVFQVDADVADAGIHDTYAASDKIQAG
jgi:hypothetical protein